YLEMGAPKALTPDQISTLNGLTADTPELDRVVEIDAKGAFSLDLAMRLNDLVLVTLEPVRAA
ncbi:beta-xylosidase, partial [Pseudomonas sp. HMWF010]